MHKYIMYTEYMYYDFWTKSTKKSMNFVLQENNIIIVTTCVNISTTQQIKHWSAKPSAV